ncbi:MAG: hypothetical protein H8D56_17970 [Planctomycetes bacterium]|nr:hypothetical protein [Planctomycetota bacterium]
MPNEERRILTEEEKSSLLTKHKSCYICNEPLDGYTREEIEFDHIYNYADGHPQELNNFAPVHASPHQNKLNCHAGKGRKKPFDYREELRIKKILKKVHGLADLCQSAIPSIYSISPDNHHITFNGVQLPLYNQKIGEKDNLYFFNEVETRFIENDNEIQLRPLEDKILPLIFNLKASIQLLPSLARIDPITNTVKLFDGQHKAVAQIIGNNKEYLPCIVFVNPDVNALRITVYEAHTDFVQQRYKKSHIDAKLADIYGQKIEAYRKKAGNPQAPYSEAAILKGESASDIRNFILSSILKEVSVETDIIRLYAAESRKDQKQRPILWQSLERFIKKFCNLTAVEEPSESDNNYRSEEIDNLIFLLRQIEEHAIRNKWNPDNPESEHHKLARTYFYRTAFNNWVNTLEEGLRFTYEQMKGSKAWGALCYQKPFPPKVRERLSDITKRLFEHSLWVQESIQDEIAKTNQDSVVTAIFKREGLDWIYITKL